MSAAIRATPPLQTSLDLISFLIFSEISFFYKRLRETMTLMFRLNSFSQFSKQFSPNVRSARFCLTLIQSEILESESEVWTTYWKMKTNLKGLMLWNFKFLPVSYIRTICYVPKGHGNSKECLGKKFDSF